MTKLELAEDIMGLYAPSARHIDIIEVPKLNFVMLDGQLEEGEKQTTSESFQDALNALNGISFTIKFMSKLDRKNPVDYNTMPLESLWRPQAKNGFMDRSNWKWTLMMMQPAHITTKTFKSAVASLRKKRSGISALKLARFETFEEGLAIQIMHVSTPGLIPMTVERMKDFAKENSYQLHGLYHEIYLSDPRHENPENERRILRYPIKK